MNITMVALDKAIDFLITHGYTREEAVKKIVRYVLLCLA